MCLRCCSLRWVSWFLLLIIEWFIPLRSLSPTVTPALPWLLLNSVPRCHIYKYFERFQRWQFYHSHEQPVPMLGNPLSEASFPNMQSEPPLAWCNLRPFPLNLSLLTGDKRKAQVEHTHSLSLLLQVGHPVMEGDQVSQAAPAFHKPKLAGPDSLVVLHGSQNDLLCDLPLAQEVRLTDLPFHKSSFCHFLFVLQLLTSSQLGPLWLTRTAGKWWRAAQWALPTVPLGSVHL